MAAFQVQKADDFTSISENDSSTSDLITVNYW